MAGHSRRHQLPLRAVRGKVACVVGLVAVALVALLLAQGTEAPQASAGRPVDGVAPEVVDKWRRALDDSVGMVWEYRHDADVPDAARDLVVRYRDEGTCLVRSAGYLDLIGDAWGCVMEGPGWVDLCVVQACDGGSVVRRVRMEAQAWEQGYGG